MPKTPLAIFLCKLALHSQIGAVLGCGMGIVGGAVIGSVVGAMEGVAATRSAAVGGAFGGIAFGAVVTPMTFALFAAIFSDLRHIVPFDDAYPPVLLVVALLGCTVGIYRAITRRWM